MLPDGVHPDRAHLWDSLELVDKEATRRLGLALEGNAKLGGEPAEQRLFATFEREESKEDGAHIPDPTGGAALHASLADEATRALKYKAAHALLVEAIRHDDGGGSSWTDDATEPAASVHATSGPGLGSDQSDTDQWREFWDATNFDAPTLPAVNAAVSQANGIKAPTNVCEMLQSPDFHGEGGWFEAVKREMAVVGKNTMVVPYAVYKRHKALFGNLVSLGHAVVALREKQDADGKRTKKRFRITFADQRQAGDGTDKLEFYSGCAKAASTKVTTQIGLSIDGKQTSDDVSGA